MNPIDRDLFFTHYRSLFGRLKQGQVDGLNELLASMEADSELMDMRHAAYMLATTKHETADTFKPIEERGPDSYFSKYNAGTKLGKALGNTEPGDGLRFKGRGYVQLTGRRNHRTMSPYVGVDLVTSPEQAGEPSVAYRIMSVGMRNGMFTGKRLDSYINGKGTDFRNARRVVNGIDRAATIDSYAQRFLVMLAASAKPCESA